MLETRIISSLEKCFPESAVTDFEELKEISVLSNERLSFQLIMKASGEGVAHRSWVRVKLDGECAKFATVRTVEYIPSLQPCCLDHYDDNYISVKPGFYPDLLLPLGNFNRAPLVFGQLRSCFITLDLDGSLSGELPLSVSLVNDLGESISTDVLKIKILKAKLPEQKLTVTQWFHGDCLATYYNVKVFSQKWWEIVESFVRTAVRNGINLLLTPVFTPPLDTAIGHERPTVQLVDVKLENGKYSFGYKKLDRWIRMCNRCGIKYFEISHLFTQWGAAHAPKIMANVNGEYKRIFGWDTVADGDEYKTFLRAFLTDFIAHMKSRGDDKRCFFHISDEPNEKVIDQYRSSKATVADLLEGYTVMDALSNVKFYDQGVVTTPIPSNNHIEPFLDRKIKGLWTYYCCGQATDNVSNRFFAMPLYRTRSIGSQFFKYDIVGFLQWGYNFYYSQGSLSFVNPYLDSTGNYFVPSGDTYSVYPAPDGTAYESIRIVSFHEALQDLRAFELCASLIGKDETVKILEKHYGEVRFNNCARKAATVLLAREEINAEIEKASK